MTVSQIGDGFQLITLLGITLPAVGVAALFNGALLVAAGICTVARPVRPARCNGLQMGGNVLTLRVQPVRNSQIDRLGAVKQARLVIHLVILKIRAVLLEVIRQLFLGLFRQRTVSVQLYVAGVQV
ncbi:hypothetical protein D3C75_1008700 [compost metagenome]